MTNMEWYFGNVVVADLITYVDIIIIITLNWQLLSFAFYTSKQSAQKYFKVTTRLLNQLLNNTPNIEHQKPNALRDLDLKTGIHKSADNQNCQRQKNICLLRTTLPNRPLSETVGCSGETAGGPRSESPLIDVEAMSDDAASPSPTDSPPPRKGQFVAARETVQMCGILSLNSKLVSQLQTKNACEYPRVLEIAMLLESM